MGSQSVSVSRVIAQPADRIFDLLADPAAHQRIDGSGSVKYEVDGPDRLELGSKFRMGMKLGVPYRMTSTVKEFEEDKLIAWAHLGRHRWRYELEAVEGGTRVTETFDWSYSLWPKGLEILGYPKRHPASMEQTLRNIESILASNE